MAASCRPRGRALALALALAPLLALAAAQDAAQETFDPDVDLNTPQTVRRYGYNSEAHVVQTADGYLLTLHRIPGPRLANASTPDGAAPSDGTGATPTATSAAAAAATARPSGADAAPTTDRPVTGGSSPPWTTEPTPPEGTWTTPSAATATSDPTSTLLPPTPTAATPPDPPATTARFVPVSSTSTSAPQTTSAGPPPSTTTDAPTSTSTAFASASPSPTSISTISSPTIPTNATSTSTPPTTTTITSPTTTTFTNSTITTAIPSTAPIIASNITTTTAPPPPPPTATTAPIPSTTSAHTTTAPTTTTPPTSTSPPTPTTTTTAPPPVSRPVIFLQHGLLGSSYDWIVAGPDKGLAYLLADAGYDVWMGNARGNTYSRAHVYLPTESSSPFWDFSFHEMGIYDLPAVIDYVLNTTGASQLHYVGHSMGTTMFFVMASAKPEAAAGVASMHALAPVVYVKHIKSPIRLLAPFARDVEFLAGLLGDGEFLPQNKILHYLAKYGCELLETERDVCENLIFILCGYDKPQFNTSILPVLLSHTPAGASTRTLIHYAQMIKSGKFQQYDLGKYGNLKKYRSLEPPTYDLSKVNVSVHLVYANNDWLAAPVDVNTLYQELHCTKTKYVVPLSSFNHLDFILAKDVKTLLYDKLLKEIPRDIDYQNYEDNFLYD
ncbi:hypothetical protein R5R35_008533 [Gryllus longicercus]|uniref:Uncharacterized protein n=1 Tax=Gryllus longicercus TaxID=2509291 RepID=A0AAN9VLD0_9ORTH